MNSFSRNPTLTPRRKESSHFNPNTLLFIHFPPSPSSTFNAGFSSNQQGYPKPYITISTSLQSDRPQSRHLLRIICTKKDFSTNAIPFFIRSCDLTGANQKGYVANNDIGIARVHAKLRTPTDESAARSA
jgi:hypothetical protein